MRVRWSGFAAVVLLGCAGARAQGVAAAEPRPLESQRFLRAVQEALSSRGLGMASGRAVRIASRRVVNAAACTPSGRHCVATVDAAERARLAGFLPERPEGDAIACVAGVEGDRGSQVLVIDAEELRYQPDPARATEAEPTVTEVEDRVRRRVLDWLAWLASQGELR